MDLNSLLKQFAESVTTPTIQRRQLLEYFSGKCDLAVMSEHIRSLCSDASIQTNPTVYDTEKFKELVIASGQLLVEVETSVELHEADGRNDPNQPDIIKTKSYRDLEDLMHPKYPINIYIAGETGLGKSTAVFGIAKKINRPVIRVNLSIATDIDDLIGGIRIVDGNTVFDPGPVAIAMDLGAILLLDECLHEEESVRIGTISEWKAIPLKNLKKNTLYPIVSFNESTHELENDTGYIISDKIDDLYEIELEDGRKIVANSNHPFFDTLGNQITIGESTLAAGVDLLVVK